MKYNRAFIVHNDISKPHIQYYIDTTGCEELEHWVIDSGESFHGEHDSEYFYFKDSRLDRGMKLPLNCVKLEFREDEV